MPEEAKRGVRGKKKPRGRGASKSHVMAAVNGSARRTASPSERRKATSASDDESQVIDRAVDVIGNKNEAMRWMGTPVRALDYSTPVSLLGTRKGRLAVIAVLGRLEHGVL